MNDREQRAYRVLRIYSWRKDVLNTDFCFLHENIFQHICCFYLKLSYACHATFCLWYRLSACITLDVPSP